jgi:hypothetical protein
MLEPRSHSCNLHLASHTAEFTVTLGPGEDLPTLRCQLEQGPSGVPVPLAAAKLSDVKVHLDGRQCLDNESLRLTAVSSLSPDKIASRLEDILDDCLEHCECVENNVSSTISASQVCT